MKQTAYHCAGDQKNIHICHAYTNALKFIHDIFFSGVMQILALSSLAVAVSLPKGISNQQMLNSGNKSDIGVMECDFFQAYSDTNPTFKGTPCAKAEKDGVG